MGKLKSYLLEHDLLDDYEDFPEPDFDLELGDFENNTVDYQPTSQSSISPNNTAELEEEMPF